MKVLVMTSDNYLWLLRPFSYLFNIYWSSMQSVLVVGYSAPEFKMPDNFEFFSVGKFTGPSQWSGTLIEGLRHIQDETIVLMMEDYWLYRTVNHACIQSLNKYMEDNSEILKIDLTEDRLNARGPNGKEPDEYASIDCYDLVRTTNDFPYQFSFQIALWNRKRLIDTLEPNKTPWEAELYTKVPDTSIILGTRQIPVRNANIILKGCLDGYQLAKLPDEHLRFITDNDWIVSQTIG